MPRSRDPASWLLHLPVAEAPYVFADVETTGLYAWGGDRICEIALVRCQGLAETVRISTLVDPLRPISTGAFRVNGITPAMLVGAPTFERIAADVWAMLDSAVLVAHNASFDVSFLARELGLAGLPRPSGQVVDTLALARRHFRLRRHGLSDLAVELGLGGTAHRALGDALIVREVFARVVRESLPAGARVASLIRLQGGRIEWPAAPTGLDLTDDEPEPNESAGQIGAGAVGDAVGELAAQLAMALLNGKRVFLVYESREGERSERWVDPVELSHLGGEPCLIGYCHLRAEQRTFLLRRISRLELAP